MDFLAPIFSSGFVFFVETEFSDSDGTFLHIALYSRTWVCKSINNVEIPRFGADCGETFIHRNLCHDSAMESLMADVMNLFRPCHLCRTNFY